MPLRAEKQRSKMLKNTEFMLLCDALRKIAIKLMGILIKELLND
jgi:hypothetical protein